MSLSQIALKKIAGCLLALVPAAGWFVFLFLVGPGPFMRQLERIIRGNDWILVPPFFFAITLAACLSTTIRWHAIPVAFVAAGALLVPITMTFRPDEVGFTVLLVVYTTATAITASRILPRLRAAAAK